MLAILCSNDVCCSYCSGYQYRLARRAKKLRRAILRFYLLNVLNTGAAAALPTFNKAVGAPAVLADVTTSLVITADNMMTSAALVAAVLADRFFTDIAIRQ